MTDWTPPKRKPNPNALSNLKQRSQQRAKTLVDDKLRAEATKLLDLILSDSDALGETVARFLSDNKEEAWDVLGIESVLPEMRQIIDERMKQFNKQADESASRIWKDQANAMQAEIDARLKAIEAKAGKTVKVVKPDLSTATIQNPHKLMPEALRHASQRMDTALVGPSGSGKTTAVRQVAGLLGLPFYFIACSDADMPAKWFGYMTASGTYVETAVYRWFKGGGVLLIDEYDNMRANIGVNLNAMLDNGIGDFPCGMVTRHPDAVCFAAGNTIGRGATGMYRGRNGLDESTIERFTTIHWGYDEELELAIVPNSAWVRFVQEVRRVVESQRMQYLVTPRASINGAKLLATGLPPEDAMYRVMFKEWPRDDVMKVLNDPAVRTTLNAVNAIHKDADHG